MRANLLFLKSGWASRRYIWDLNLMTMLFLVFSKNIYNYILAFVLNAFNCNCPSGYLALKFWKKEEEEKTFSNWQLVRPTAFFFSLRFYTNSRGQQQGRNIGTWSWISHGDKDYTSVQMFCSAKPSFSSILSAHCFVNRQVLDIVNILRKIGMKMCQSFHCISNLYIF